MGLTELFDVILIEGELGFGKPDHRIYALALQELMVAAADAWISHKEWACSASGLMFEGQVYQKRPPSVQIGLCGRYRNYGDRVKIRRANIRMEPARQLPSVVLSPGRAAHSAR